MAWLLFLLVAGLVVLALSYLNLSDYLWIHAVLFLITFLLLLDHQVRHE